MELPRLSPERALEPGATPAAIATIVTALPEELAPLLRRARDAKPVGPRSYLARLAGRRVVIARTGDGAAAAERGLDGLLRKYRPGVVIAAGVAGALDPALGRGALVTATEVRDAAGAAPEPDPAWRRRAERLGALPAVVFSSERMLTAAAEKARLAASLAGPAVVDQESAAWARTAARHGVPYVVLRVVLDAATDELPEFLADCVNADGGVSRGRVVGQALLRPGSLRPLWRLRHDVAAAAGRLAEALAALAESEA